MTEPPQGRLFIIKNGHLENGWSARPAAGQSDRSVNKKVARQSDSYRPMLGKFESMKNAELENEGDITEREIYVIM